MPSRNPDGAALIDELGTLTFKEIDERTNALAAGLADAGVKEGDGVAIMCRNHRGFVEATVANAKLGANSLYLNTAFAGPQITEVVKREKPVAIVFDQEFTDLLEDAGTRRKRFVGWVDDPDTVEDPTLEELIQNGSTEQPVPPENTGKMIILTSGTTGTPKGANRGSPDTLDPATSFLSRIPLEYRGQVAHRRPAVPLVGLRPLQPGPAAGHDDGADAQVRPRGVAAADRSEQGRRAGGGAGDDAADPGPARGDARASTTRRR